MPNYIVNKNTRRIHIEGNCQYAMLSGENWAIYKSEKEAREDNGTGLIQCKTCWKKRDER